MNEWMNICSWLFREMWRVAIIVTIDRMDSSRMASQMDMIIWRMISFWKMTLYMKMFRWKKGRGSAAHGPRPATRGGPAAQSCFSTIFLSSGKSTRMHRSASSFGVQNLISVTILKIIWNLFDHFFPLLVVKWKTLSFSVSRISWKQNAKLSACIEGDWSLDYRLGV